MLIDKKYTIGISNRTKGYFKKLGYNIDSDKLKINVNVNDLSKDVQCDKCGHIFKRKYKQYLRYLKLYNYDTCQSCKYEKVSKTNMKKYGVKNPFQSEKIKEKIKETNIKKYGFDNPSKNEDIKKKIKLTNLKKYGVESHLSLPDIRKRISITKSNLGLQLPTDLIDDFKIYRNKVNSLTRKIKEKLYEDWDGTDYYDKECIKDNINLESNDRLYPTIDHKISIYYGFMNNISEEEISKIDNLCITKRYINCSKHNKIEDKFKL